MSGRYNERKVVVLWIGPALKGRLKPRSPRQHLSLKVVGKMDEQPERQQAPPVATVMVQK